jgi:hypothetical protein
MKKIFASLLILAATTTAFAQAFSAKATLTLKSENGKVSTLTIVQSDDASLVEYNSELNMDFRSMALYAYDAAADKKYEVYVTNDLSTLNIGVITGGETNFTLTVTDITGTLYVDGQAIQNGDVIPFTFAGDKLKAFAVSTVAPTPGICHQNGKLEITAYKGATVEVVEYDDNTKVAVPATNITLDYQEIDLANVAAGKQYVVIVTMGADVEKLVIKK